MQKHTDSGCCNGVPAMRMPFTQKFVEFVSAFNQLLFILIRPPSMSQSLQNSAIAIGTPAAASA